MTLGGPSRVTPTARQAGARTPRRTSHQPKLVVGQLASWKGTPRRPRARCALAGALSTNARRVERVDDR